MKKPRSLDFERYLRHTMPKKLNLSDAKSAAIESVFYAFADVLRPLESKAPAECHFFIDEFVQRIEKASRKRCPKNHIIRDGHYVSLPNSQTKVIGEHEAKKED